MQDIKIGRIRPVWKGEYDVNTAYEFYDWVSAAGSSYICISKTGAPAGEDLTTSEYWACVAERGYDSTLRLGQIITSLVPIESPLVFLLDGQAISAVGTYGGFVSYIASLRTKYPQLFCTEGQWRETVEACGVCGKFVYEEGSYLRLPLLCTLEGTTDISMVGELVPGAVTSAELVNVVSGAIGDSYGISLASTYGPDDEPGSNFVPTDPDPDFNAGSPPSSGGDEGGSGDGDETGGDEGGDTGDDSGTTITGNFELRTTNTVNTKVLYYIVGMTRDVHGYGDISSTGTEVLPEGDQLVTDFYFQYENATINGVERKVLKRIYINDGTGSFILLYAENTKVTTLVQTVYDDSNSGCVLTKTDDGVEWKTLADIDALPDDGVEGQILAVNADGNAEWINQVTGLPEGGTEGQLLVTNADGDAEWSDVSDAIGEFVDGAIKNVVPEGGTEGQLLAVNTDGETEWVDAPTGVPDAGTAGQVLGINDTGNIVWTDPATGLPDDGTEGQVLSVGATGEAEWIDPVTGIPDNGTTGQVLTVGLTGDAEWTDPVTGIPIGGTEGQILTKTDSGAAWADAPTDIPDDGTNLQVLTTVGDDIKWNTVVSASQEAPEERVQSELLYLEYGDTDTADTINVHKYVLLANQFTFDESDGLFHTTINKQPYEHIVGVYQDGELVLADVAEEENVAHITALQPITGYAMFGFSGAAEGSITLAGQLERIDALETNKTTAAQAAHAAAPSGDIVELTAGATGSQYTAPSDGYFAVSGTSTTAGGYIYLGSNNIAVRNNSTSASAGVQTFLPVSAGATVDLYYSGVSVTNIIFIYANGSKP